MRADIRRLGPFRALVGPSAQGTWDADDQQTYRAFSLKLRKRPIRLLPALVAELCGTKPQPGVEFGVVDETMR